MSVFLFVIFGLLLLVLMVVLFGRAIGASVDGRIRAACGYGGSLILIAAAIITAFAKYTERPDEPRHVVCSVEQPARLESVCSHVLIGGVMHTICRDHCWCGKEDFGLADECTAGTETIRKALPQ